MYMYAYTFKQVIHACKYTAALCQLFTTLSLSDARMTNFQVIPYKEHKDRPS